MEYRGAGLSKNLSEEPWNYYNQERRGRRLGGRLLWLPLGQGGGGCFSCHWGRGTEAASVPLTGTLSSQQASTPVHGRKAPTLPVAGGLSIPRPARKPI